MNRTLCAPASRCASGLAAAVAACSLWACDGGGGAGPIPPLEKGEELTAPCGPAETGVFDSVIGVIKTISSFVPSGPELVQQRSCERTTRELSLGTGLGGGAGTYGNGGRGEVLADGAICLLKGLAGAPLRSEAVVPLPLTGGDVSVKQVLGFTGFDPVAKRFTGYQALRACVPIAGCFPITAQGLTATLRRSTPARPSGLAAGGAPITDAFSLEVAAARTRYELDVKLPAIPIATPVGVISVTPYLRDRTAGTVNHTPFADPPEAPHRLYKTPVGITKPLTLVDVYGRSGPVVLLGLQAQAKTEGGMSSLITLGGRDADPGRAPWTAIPDPRQPVRPDVAFVDDAPSGKELLARSPLEHEPQLDVELGAHVKYPDDPLAFLPDWLKVFKVEFFVIVTPNVSARLAGQTQLLWREGHWQIIPPDAKPTNPAAFYLQAQSSASIAAALKVRVVLKVTRTFLFSDIQLINVDKTLDLLDLRDTRYGQVAQSFARTAARVAARKDVELRLADGTAPPAEPFYDACFQVPQADKAPEPEIGGYEPQPGTFSLTEFPCNVCAYQKAYKDPQTGETQPAQSGYLFPGAAPSFECIEKFNGCFDVCAWDPVKKQLGQVVRPALKHACDQTPK